MEMFSFRIIADAGMYGKHLI